MSLRDKNLFLKQIINQHNKVNRRLYEMTDEPTTIAAEDLQEYNVSTRKYQIPSKKILKNIFFSTIELKKYYFCVKFKIYQKVICTYSPFHSNISLYQDDRRIFRCK